MYAENMEQDPEADALAESPPEVDAEEADPEEEAEGQDEVREMAIVALGLLKQEVKVMLHQVKQLVKANSQLASQVFTTDIGGWTPIHACALRGKRKVLKAMLHAGIDVNARMGQPEGLPAACTLLHISANRSDKKVADYLLHHGADVNARDSFGRTPLFYAQRSGNRDLAKLLVDSGAHEVGPPAEVEVTSSSVSGSGPARMAHRLSEELTTPEPKLTRFCFLPVPQQHHHHHHHRHQHSHLHSNGQIAS